MFIVSPQKMLLISTDSVNMLKLICIWSGLAWKRWLEADQMILAHCLAPRPDPLGQNLTHSARTKSVWAGFAQHDPDHLWKNATESESGKLVVSWLPHARSWSWWFLHTGLLPDQMHLAKPWPGHPDRIWVSFAQYDPCLLWKIGTESDAGSRIRHIRSGPIVAARWP